MRENKVSLSIEKIKNLKFSNKVKVLIIALVLVVIGYVFFSANLKKSETKVSTKEVVGDNLYLSYITQTESRLINVLNSVKDLSNVKVFLNITQSPKITYLTEEKVVNDSASSKIVVNTIVLAKDGTLTYPIAVLEELPEIKGVLIVAKGAGNTHKKLEIVNVVATLLNVDVSKVEVLEGK